jgi:hypothetical protein
MHKTSERATGEVHRPHVAPTQELVIVVRRDAHHQICANDAAAHPTMTQEAEAAEHLALGDVSPCARHLSNSTSESLVVRHEGFRSPTCEWILVRARAIDRRNWNIQQAQVYGQLP